MFGNYDIREWIFCLSDGFGSNPTDLTDEDLTFAQDTPLAGHFVRQWKLRMHTQETALKEVANIKPRPLLLSTESFNFADITLGGSALFYKAQTLKSLPRWRGPTKILDFAETGETATLQSQTSEAASYCARNI